MDGSIRLIVIASVLLMLGVVLPYLMVIDRLQSTLPLNFAAAMSSTLGFLLGFIGIAQYVRARK